MKRILICSIILFNTSLTSNGQFQNFRTLGKRIKAIVNDKSLAKDKKWIVYADPEMELKLGKLSPLDTVLVTGWSTWTFYVEAKDLKGYISWLSLNSTPELDLLSTKIKGESETDEKKKPQPAPRTPNATFKLSVSKKEVFVGECFTVSMDLLIDDKNRVPMQFHQLGVQIFTMLQRLSQPYSPLISKNFIFDVAGEHEQESGNKGYTKYRIFNSCYCPTKLQDIYFPPLELMMVQNKDRANEKLVSFTSEPLTVKVNILPAVPSSFNNHKLVGNFELSDRFIQKTSTINSPVDYMLTISGEGLTFPIIAPQLEIPNVSAALVNVTDTDTIINQKYFSSKTFQYRLVFKTTGQYDLSNKINFSFFDKGFFKLTKLKTSSSILISDSEVKMVIKNPSEFYSKENLILIDGSQSMQIEDYTPYRLKSITNGIKNFLTQRKKCDIGIIEFAGYPQFVNIAQNDSCYTKSLINSIEIMSAKKAWGTAIGDAVIFSSNYIKQSTLDKNIVIIGDGDNTSGIYSPELAASLAKENKIKIFAIGVGNKGLVPYGKDYFGRPQMVDNTFSDATLKQIAAISGGEYFWAKDAEDLAIILKRIFP